jgi:hypothetical protein
MNVQDVKAHAKIAVLHVYKTMPRGAANIAQMGGQDDEEDVTNRVTASRNVMGLVANFLQGENQIDAKLTVLQQALSTKFQAGNCTEQACAAFLFLQRRGVQEIQLLSISMQPYENDRHVFVAMSDDQLAGTSPTAWTDDRVVICDPWLGEIARKAENAGYRSGVYPPEHWCEYMEGARVSKVRQHNVETRATAY